MSNDPVEPGDGADDLIGRWLAHHKAANEGDTTPPHRVPTAAPPSEAVAPRLARPSASAALAELRSAPVEVAEPPKRRLVTRTQRAESGGPEERKRRPLVPRSASAQTPRTGTGGAARGLLAAARAATPAPTLASQTRPTPEKPVPVPLLPVEPVVQTPVPSAPAMEMPAVYEFTPLKSSRRFLSLMLITGLVASGQLGHVAYQSRDTMAIGIAGIVTLATMVIWAIRAGATTTRLTVRSGQLEIVRQGGRMVFDLASNYTSIQVTGKPGSKKWKVQFLRRGTSPVVVDSTMVDGQDFMRILEFFRPELAG